VVFEEIKLQNIFWML